MISRVDYMRAIYRKDGIRSAAYGALNKAWIGLGETGVAWIEAG